MWMWLSSCCVHGRCLMSAIKATPPHVATILVVLMIAILAGHATVVLFDCPHGCLWSVVSSVHAQVQLLVEHESPGASQHCSSPGLVRGSVALCGGLPVQMWIFLDSCFSVLGVRLAAAGKSTYFFVWHKPHQHPKRSFGIITPRLPDLGFH